jgi:hypothetical protein
MRALEANGLPPRSGSGFADFALPLTALKKLLVEKKRK